MRFCFGLSVYLSVVVAAAAVVAVVIVAFVWYVRFYVLLVQFARHRKIFHINSWENHMQIRMRFMHRIAN